MKRLAVGLLGAALLLGLKFYNKNSDAKEIKARLVELCEGDTRCTQSVEANFESCFDSSYKMKRRGGSTLETDQLVRCLNTASGKSYFASSK